jgi:hypothetical protein
MKTKDDVLIEIYLEGFDDELNGSVERDDFEDEYSNRAYALGRINAIVGDDISSIDLKGRKEILRDIKLNLK